MQTDPTPPRLGGVPAISDDILQNFSMWVQDQIRLSTDPLVNFLQELHHAQKGLESEMAAQRQCLGNLRDHMATLGDVVRQTSEDAQTRFLQLSLDVEWKRKVERHLEHQTQMAEYFEPQFQDMRQRFADFDKRLENMCDALAFSSENQQQREGQVHSLVDRVEELNLHVDKLRYSPLICPKMSHPPGCNKFWKLCLPDQFHLERGVARQPLPIWR
jgi:DNA repair exonuclease SbcCD ATPase subunit